MRPGRKDDISAVPVLLNIKVRMQSQHSITPPSLHDLIRGSFTFTYILAFDLHSALFSVILFINYLMTV
jgi:hypothetical protein